MHFLSFSEGMFGNRNLEKDDVSATTEEDVIMNVSLWMEEHGLNTFILKTTIMSSAYEKMPIEDIKPADLGEKSAVNVGKVADSAQTANNHTERLPIKMPFEIFVKRYEEHAYNEPTIISLQQIYEGIDVNQIFGSAYLVKILECSDRTARNLMAKLREMDVIVPVTGKGKGMYRFKYDNE